MDAIDGALAPLKPALRAITSSLPSPLDDLALSLLGPRCHASLLQRLDLSAANGECTSLAISKALGIAIVSAAAVVKVPQLLKLLNAQSAAGLSLSSYVLETASFTVNLVYSFRNAFPFSTFGETAFIAIQDLAITILILVYTNRSVGAAAMVAGFATAAYMLASPQVVDMDTLRYYQAGASVLGIASKVPQIYTVWREGGTGQLSAFAVFNYLLGSLSRIFTTLQEVDDPIILWGFVAGFALNAVLAAQMVYYWNSPAPSKVGKPAAASKPRQHLPSVASSSGSSAAPAGTVKSRAATTRRKA